MKLLRFATTHGDSDLQDQSLADYLSRAKEGQDKIYYLLADNNATAQSSPHLEQLLKSGTEVLLLTDKIDPWMADHLTEYQGKAFQDVGRGQLSLPDEDDSDDQELANDEHKEFLDKILESLSERVVAVNASQRLIDSPACVVTADQDLTPQLRRMLEASGQLLPETKPTFEVNVEHPLVQRLAAESDDERFGQLSELLLDHSLLAEGTALENPAAYVQRMNQYLLNSGFSES